MRLISITDWLSYSIRRSLLDASLERISADFKGVVLEVGCGKKKRRGTFKPPLQATSQWLYMDIETSRQPHIQADTQYLPIKNFSCDTVVCLEVIEYVNSPQSAIQELSAALKPGGKLILSLPFMHRFDNAVDSWRISDTKVSDILGKNGFTAISCSHHGGACAVIASILKFATSAIPHFPLRIIAGYCIYLPVALLQILDPLIMKYIPSLKTFSTGYLFVATKKGGTHDR